METNNHQHYSCEYVSRKDKIIMFDNNERPDYIVSYDSDRRQSIIFGIGFGGEITSKTLLTNHSEVSKFIFELFVELKKESQELLDKMFKSENWKIFLYFGIKKCEIIFNDINNKEFFDLKYQFHNKYVFKRIE